MGNKNLTNPLKAIGFDIDIDKLEVKKKINDYVTMNSAYTLEGYKYKLYNAYSNLKTNDFIQIARYERNDSEESEEEKFEKTLFHHTNNCVWKCCIDICLSTENLYIVRSCTPDQRGAAIISFLNADLKPYFTKGSFTFAQVNCIGYDVKIFSGDEKNKYTNNNFKLHIKDVDGKKEDDIYIGDSTIILAGISNPDKEYSQLNYIRGEIIEVQEITQELLGISSTYMMAVVKTEFGKTPVLFVKENISYSTNESIEIGDTIEALISVTGDIMLNPKASGTCFDKVSAYESFRRALETGDYEVFRKLLSSNCTYESNNNKKEGKEEIYNLLYRIYNEDKAEGKEYLTCYAEVTDNPINHFNIEDEILCLSESNDLDHIVGDFKIELNENNLIEHIYFTTDPDMKFRIFDPYDSEIRLDEERRIIFNEMLQILKDKNISEVDINGILIFANQDYFLPGKMLKWLKENYNKELTTSDILGEQYKLSKMYEESHPIKNYIERLSDMIDEYQEDDDFKNYSWKEGNEDHSVLNIVSNSSMHGELRTLLSDEGIFSIDMNLSYCKLDGIKDNNMYIQQNIDVYEFEADYYNYNEAINELSECLKLYKKIRIWSNHKSAHKFVFPFFIINKFKDVLKNKDVTLNYEDGLDGKDFFSDLLTGEMNKLIEKDYEMTNEDIENYSKEWERILNENSDLRIVENDKIISISFESLNDRIIAIVNENKNGIKRVDLIKKLHDNHIINDFNLIVFNYLIDRLVELNLLKSDHSKDEAYNGHIINDLIST